MDNLFAVMSPKSRAKNSNSLINNTLFSDIINSSALSVYQSHDNNNTIYLLQYTAQNKLLTCDLQVRKSTLTTPVIGNIRVDNESTLSALLANTDVNSGASNNAQLSDEQLLLNSYKRQGSDCFSKIKGNFQTIFWDEQSQRLCAAIDPFSSRSLFYLTHNGKLYIASEAKTLTQVANITPTVNKTAVSQWLSGRPNPDISMFNEISRLPSGSCLEYSEQHGITITKFWDIKSDCHINYKQTDDYKSHFYELLQSSVANRLTAKKPDKHNSVFCQMSGGMDSTSVTAIANQLINNNNSEISCELHTLSHRYQHTQSCDESNNINDMIAKLDLQHQHYIDLDQFKSSSFAELYPTDFDNPGIVLSPKYHQELALMQSVGANVLLTGNGGDETCWGHSASYRSRLYKGEFGVINEVIEACHQLNEPVARSLYKLFMPSSLQNLVKLARNKPTSEHECPPWLTADALAIVTHETDIFINPFSARFNPAKHARYQGLKTTSTYNSMRSYQKVASNYGIDVRHPFFDTDVVEFSFAIPEKLLIQGIYPKWLLRHTMQDYLPASVCWNKHKTVFDHHFANLVRSNKVELRKLLAHEGLQDLGLVNNAILLREFDAVVNNPNGYLNVDMLYAILTQLWYQTHCL